MHRSLKLVGMVTAVLVVAVAACSNKTETPTPTGTSSAAEVPQLTVADFTADFSAMEQLKDLAAQGDGLIGVLLPDTTTSTRYVQYDAPYLKQAFEAAGLSSDQFKVDNAQGSNATMQQQAEADITAGASVLLVDAKDSGTGAAIEANAESKGVKVIDYDRLMLGGPADRYYVSFDNVAVGGLIGQGLVDCVDAWKVKDPNVLVMEGDPTDNNAKLFAQGYNETLKPYFDDGSYVNAGTPAGSWDGPTSATNFEQAYTADPKINAVVNPNDNTAASVIAVLQRDQIPAETFPTTGQDASTPGLQNILLGYQCGTVYKPVYAEAQAAVALAIFLRAGVTPPTSLVTDTTTDSEIGKDVASVYTTPVWVTADNMADTVVADEAVTVADLCAGKVASACQKAGIS